MKLLFLFSIIILSLNAVYSSKNREIVKNSISMIEEKSEKITLKLIKAWGSENELDDNIFFKNPSDIIVDKENNIYVSDSLLHCIKVFSKKKGFIQKIGKKGRGPGLLLTPTQLGFNEKNHLIVNDFGNRRIQEFSKTGRLINSYKTSKFFTYDMVFLENELIAVCNNLFTKTNPALITIIKQGNSIFQNIGVNMLPPQINLSYRGGKFDSGLLYYCKNTKTLYYAYRNCQLIYKIKPNGEFINTIYYDTPINILELKWSQKRLNYDLINSKKFYSNCIDLSCDDKGFLFIVITSRKPKNNERTSMIFTEGTVRFLPKSSEFPDYTDMYRLIVFGKDGKVIASKQLEVFCHKIYIKNNRLFIIDKIFNKVIYEYEYTIKE